MTQAAEEEEGPRKPHECVLNRCQEPTFRHYIAMESKDRDPITFPFCWKHWYKFKDFQIKKGYIKYIGWGKYLPEMKWIPV